MEIPVFDQKGKSRLLLVISVLAVVTLFVVGRIPQDPAYHQFADTRQLFGLNNFWNVVSNLPFLLVGLIGLSRFPHLSPEIKPGYLVLCLGVILVGFGSAYYHQAPSNSTLLWDRLPMTVAFMALLSLLLEERVINGHKQLVLLLLVAVGIAAALYWAWTESRGLGDLRPYVLVQFLPIVLMPLILLLYPEQYLRNSFLFYAFGLYFLAKACEHFDTQIYGLTGGMSGHTLKHVVAAGAVLCIIRAVTARSANNSFKPKPLRGSA
jgi:hypothetical protein